MEVCVMDDRGNCRHVEDYSSGRTTNIPCGIHWCFGNTVCKLTPYESAVIETSQRNAELDGEPEPNGVWYHRLNIRRGREPDEAATV